MTRLRIGWLRIRVSILRRRRDFSPWELRPSGLLRSEWWWEIVTTRCVMTQKIVDLSYFAEEARNHGYSTFQNAQTYSEARLAPYSTVSCGKNSAPWRRHHVIVAFRTKRQIAELLFQYTISCPGCCLSKRFSANSSGLLYLSNRCTIRLLERNVKIYIKMLLHSYLKDQLVHNYFKTSQTH